MTNSEAVSDVTVAIVTHNSGHLVPLLESTLQGLPHVIVVDNASEDGTADALQARLPSATVIKSATNIGFGAANNLALRECATPFLLLANPDTSFTVETVRELRDTLRRTRDAAVIAPKAARADRSQQKVHVEVPRASRRGHLIPAQWLAGCFWMTRTDALRAVGGFDERFFMYYEDDDLCNRLRGAGYGLWLDPGCEITHQGGNASRKSLAVVWRKAYHHARSKRLYLQLYSSRRRALWYAVRSVPAGFLGALAALVLMMPKRALQLLARACASFARIDDRAAAREDRACETSASALHSARTARNRAIR